jgi:hypothetical protein
MIRITFLATSIFAVPVADSPATDTPTTVGRRTRPIDKLYNTCEAAERRNGSNK